MKNVYPYGETTIFLVVFLTGLVCMHPPASAQRPVRGVYAPRYKATAGSTYTAGVSAGSGLSGTYTYKFGTQTVTSNNYQRLDTFTITSSTGGTSVFVFNNAAVPVVKFRRVNNANATGSRKALWFESDGATPSATVAVALRPAYDDSLESIFAKRLFNMGVDNVFENGTVTNNNNIERVDVIFPGGLKTFNPDSAGFTIFDRGAAGGNDSFMIAAIKSLDASGNPSDYYPAVRVGPANYGAAAGTTVNFHGLRREESETNLKLFIAAGSQERQGVFFSFTSLGFPYSSATSTRLVYGYSIMATDVNRAAPGTPINMVNYTNATIFPTNTELGTVGGIDMVAVTGVAATTSSSVLLPVGITGFTARPDGHRVVLSWQLADGELPGQQSIERSADGIGFSFLLNPVAPVTPGMQYATDEHPLTGQSYYRLRMVDKSGDISYSTIVKVSAGVAAISPVSITVYPMPVVNDQFTVSVSGLPGVACWLEVTDMNGRRVYGQTITGSRPGHLQVNMPARLPAGVYSLRIISSGGAAPLTKKLLIE